MRTNEKTTLVLKIGGNQVEDEAFLAGFVAAVAGLLAEHSVIMSTAAAKRSPTCTRSSGSRPRRSRGCARRARKACGWSRWC